MRKRFSPVYVLLSAALLVLLLNSCEKEYSYEGGPFSNGSATGSAVYTLVGAGGDCTDPVISGQYYEGVPPGAGNTVQLQVKVDSIGTYAITTNSNAGFSFSTSGSFTTTGTQTITLTANGTPSAVGNFIFTPPVREGCNFKVEVKTAPPAIAGFTFTGAPGTCTNSDVIGAYTAGSALTNTNTVTINVNVTSIGAYSITTDTLDGITFSASGSFTKTGNQDVKLMGSGTPEFARYLPFSVFSPGTPGCAFNVTVLDPAPLATYVLESGYGTTSNPCTYTVHGSATHNISLNNTNTVTIRVYVTVEGNFTISTSVIDGMTFSYSGTFTSPGSQDVILSGVGIPVDSGMYTFFPNIIGPHPLGGETCSFEVSVF